MNLTKLGFHKISGAQVDLYKRLKPLILNIRNARNAGEVNKNISSLTNLMKQKPHLRKKPRQLIYNGTDYSFKTPGNTKKYHEGKIMENFLHNPQFDKQQMGLIKNLKRSKRLDPAYIRIVEHGQKKWWEL